MQIQDLQKSPHKLKMFLLYSIIGLLILITLNFILLPYIFDNKIPSFDKTLTDIFNNLTALVSSSIATVLFLLLITPKVLNESEVNIINPHDLRNTLDSITKKTESFTYYGHIARWSRSVTLAKLLKEANEEHITKSIDLIILNPNNKKLITYFANFGHGERGKGNDVKSAKQVKVELFITILTVYNYNQESFLNINLYLSSHISLFRMDLTQNALVLTKPYSTEPALLFYKDTFFYKSYKEEIKIAKEQSKQLFFDFNFKKLNKNSCKDILNKMDLDTTDLLDDDITIIMDGIKKPVSPY